MTINEFLEKCKEKNLNPVLVLVNAIQQVFNDYEKALKKDEEKNKILAEAKYLLVVANFTDQDDMQRANDLYKKIEEVLT